MCARTRKREESEENFPPRDGNRVRAREEKRKEEKRIREKKGEERNLPLSLTCARTREGEKERRE